MNKEVLYDASVDAQMEERSTASAIRDEAHRIETPVGFLGQITGYRFKILIRDKPAFEGILSLGEMASLYKFYSAEGVGMTQREVSNTFPAYTFQEIKRLLRAFNITKASIPLAPHILETKTLEEQTELVHKNIETRLIKNVERTRKRHTEKLLKDTLVKYSDLKEQVADFKEFAGALNINACVEIQTPRVSNKKTLVVYLSDMHIGAAVSRYSLYENPFTYEEAKRRLQLILNKIIDTAASYHITNIVVCNVGDSLDGFNNETTRGGHYLPQNMTNKEQFTNYIQLMVDFFASLSTCGQFTTIQYYVVPGGNHDGDFGFFANKALEGRLYQLNASIKTVVFEKFIESFEVDGHTFILCHGKDEKDMFKNYPLVLNDKIENQIVEYLDYKKITGKIHFVKGDLHQTATTYGKRFRYKSVASFFGSSEWVHKNMGNTSAACDIDIIDGEFILETRIILNGENKNS